MNSTASEYGGIGLGAEVSNLSEGEDPFVMSPPQKKSGTLPSHDSSCTISIPSHLTFSLMSQRYMDSYEYHEYKLDGLCFKTDFKHLFSSENQY